MGWPCSPACCLLAQDPLNASQRCQPKFEAGSPKLSSAEPFLRALMLAGTAHPPSPCNPSLCPPLLQGGEEDKGMEKALTLIQGPGIPDLCTQHNHFHSGRKE